MEFMVGLFINTLPVRVIIDQDKNIVEWLSDLQTHVAHSKDFDYFPLFEIQELSNVEKGIPLFDSILVFENYPIDSNLKQSEYSLKIGRFDSKEQTNYPITVVSSPSDPIIIKISYDSSLFTEEYIGSILRSLKYY